MKRGEPIINLQALGDEFKKLEYPLYFLDYESYNPAIPRLEGYKPYQHIVFQYSVHIIEEKGAQPKHVELLVTDEGDPSQKIAEHLATSIGPSGSIIVWNKTFEAGRNAEMGERYPDYQQFILDLNDRIFDLMEIFSKGYYIHPDFHGSASIKNVLPVLVEEFALKYKELPIPKGDDAMMAWLAIINGEIPIEMIEEKRSNLLQYCELDTMAMVKNWEALEKTVTSQMGRDS